MSRDFQSRIDPTRHLAGQDGASAEPDPPPPPDAGGTESPGGDTFSLISAGSRHKAMLELRFLSGNAKALAYSYLVSIDLDPSAEIRMDFSGCDVRIAGRNLGRLFAALVAQRVAVVWEADGLHAEATGPEGATVVTRIEVIAPADAAPDPAGPAPG